MYDKLDTYFCIILYYVYIDIYIYILICRYLYIRYIYFYMAVMPCRKGKTKPNDSKTYMPQILGFIKYCKENYIIQSKAYSKKYI